MYLNESSFHILINSLAWPRPNNTLHSNHILQPQIIRSGMSFRKIFRQCGNLNKFYNINKFLIFKTKTTKTNKFLNRVKYLDNASVVSEIEKSEATVHTV